MLEQSIFRVNELVVGNAGNSPTTIYVLFSFKCLNLIL